MDAMTALFELLSHFGAQPGMRLAKEARPIVFELLPEKTKHWHFNPARREALFGPGDIVDAPLRVRCEPSLLLRLLAEKDFKLSPEDPFEYDGDIKLLRHMAASLRPNEFSF